MKKPTLVLLAALLLVSCSQAPEADDAAGTGRSSDRASESTPGAEAATSSPEPTDGGTGKDGSDGGEDSGGDASAGGDDDGAGDDDDGDVFNDGGGEDDASSALHPAAGRYIYAQRGYESFCQAASCKRQDLPADQPVEVSVKGRTGSRAVVVSKAEASDNRMVRTTATFTRSKSLVTNVYARFAYEGFTFENTYQPEPPVEALRFPLERGAAWSGRWRDSTSGTYEVRVLGTELVSVGGASVNAFKLETVTEFSGEFEGSARSVVWLDPASKVVVKTTGKVELESAFGRYITEFENELRSGPGF